MARLAWDVSGERIFETGIDRGVVYVAGYPAAAWTGLISVNEAPDGGDPKSYYLDGVKYLNLSGVEEYTAAITAYTYPDVFGLCDGSIQVLPGLFFKQQARRPFHFTYRTRVGNDIQGVDYAYQIHLVYNALATPADRAYATISNQVEAQNFTWRITTKPVKAPGYRHTQHIVVDSRFSNPTTLSALEDLLYGTDVTSPSMPTIEELIEIFEADTLITVTDNGDGTYTVEGPDAAVYMTGPYTYEVNAPSAIPIDEDTYTISSL